jgi:molecular chaperone HscB
MKLENFDLCGKGIGMGFDSASPSSEKPKTIPSKCSHCNAVIRDTAVCDYCHALNPSAVRMDYYHLLGLPETFDLDPDVLWRKYLALSRHAHPDFHTGDTEDVQNLHLKVSAALNDAYRTLSDPASRAEYLLEVLGGRSIAEDKSVPDGFLETMAMMQEEIAEARETRDADELARLRDVLETQRDGRIRRVAELFRTHQETVACKAVAEGLLNEIRMQVNAVSYVKKLLSQAK